MSVLSSLRGKISNLLRPFSTNKHLRYGFPIIGLLVGSHLYLSVFPLESSFRKRAQDSKASQSWLRDWRNVSCRRCLTQSVERSRTFYGLLAQTNIFGTDFLSSDYSSDHPLPSRKSVKDGKIIIYYFNINHNWKQLKYESYLAFKC